MAITKSSALMGLMPPAPGRFQMASQPLAWATPTKCQVSHSKDSTTRGKPQRLTKPRTKPSMLPAIKAINTPPHSAVVSTSVSGEAGSKPQACFKMAAVPSRITTSSNDVQPINCKMLSSTGKRAIEGP